MDMESLLPITLQELLGSLLRRMEILSWRIYGDKQVTISIRLEETSSETKIEMGRLYQDTSYPQSATSATASYRRKSPSSQSRDSERLVSWASKKGVSESNIDSGCYDHNNKCSTPMFTDTGILDGGKGEIHEYESADMCDGELQNDYSGVDRKEECVASGDTTIDTGIQCTTYDIATNPLHHRDTQTNKKQKSKTIQTDKITIVDASTGVQINQSTVSSSTDRVSSSDVACVTDSSYLQRGIGTSTRFTADKAVSMSPVACSVETSSADLEYKICVSSQVEEGDVDAGEYMQDDSGLSSQYGYDNSSNYDYNIAQSTDYQQHYYQAHPHSTQMRIQNRYSNYRDYYRSYGARNKYNT